ncbi:[Pyruvate dehydrogenase (acetyl-transferring)] kinase isozyme 2 [Sorochytrium milnesiophthora]
MPPIAPTTVLASLAQTSPTPLSIGLMRSLASSTPLIQQQLPIRHAKSVHILGELHDLLDPPSPAARAVAWTVDRLVEDISVLTQLDAQSSSVPVSAVLPTSPAIPSAAAAAAAAAAATTTTPAAAVAATQATTSTSSGSSSHDAVALAATLHIMRDRHGAALNGLQAGLRGLVGSSMDRKKLKDVRRLLDDFYTVNIGSNLLIDEHLSLIERKENIVKVIDAAAIAQRAIDDARALCSRHYGFDAPKVELQNRSSNLSTVYIENHLHRILYECLKNSLRAVVEAHSPKQLPPVQLMMVNGGEDMVFKLSDQGHGIAQSRFASLFNYGIHPTSRWQSRQLASTGSNSAAPLPPPSSSSSPPSPPQTTTVLSSSNVQTPNKPYLAQPLAGSHHGLSLARLHARFFGGDLQLVSMEGHGTDAFVYLHKEKDEQQ